MAKSPDRRHYRLINRKFQFGLAWRVVLVYLGFFYLGVIVLFAPSMYHLASNTADLAAQESAASEFLLLHRRVWPAILLSFGGVFAYTLLFSHRIAGPVHRINAVLRQLIDGEHPESITFRKADYFKPTAELLTELSRKLSAK